MDCRETHGSRENTQHLWKRMLWLTAVYSHIWLIQVFFQHAFIVNADMFSVPGSVLSAGITQGVGCFQEPSFPGPKATQNMGGQCKQRLGNFGSMRIKSWKTGLSISQEKSDGAGSNRTQQSLQEHLPPLLQSQQSLLKIRHP